MKKNSLFIAALLLTLGLLSQEAKVSIGKIDHRHNFPSKFVAARNVDVWLPRGYSPKKKYAVLYMHDGQMLFDSTVTWNKKEWGIDETMGKLLKAKEIKDCIVVGVWNSEKFRHIEYFPQKALIYLSQEQKNDLLNTVVGAEKKRLFFDGPISDNYLKFLVFELKPFIDSLYSTKPDQANTFVAGSSMGGLISMYAICEYPKVFGGAACLSTHWPGTFAVENNPVPVAFLAYLTENLPSANDHKFYFDYGTATLDSTYKPFQLQADEIMKSKGYDTSNWITKEFPGEDHSENAWKKRFDIPVRFLLGK